MQAGLPFNTFAAIDALQAAREMAKFDLEDTIIIVTAIIERFKVCSLGERLSIARTKSPIDDEKGSQGLPRAGHLRRLFKDDVSGGSRVRTRH